MDIKNEIWKDIDGYKGLYQVSNFGRVKSLDRIRFKYQYKCQKKINMLYKGKILSPGDSKGYFIVCLMINNKYKTISVHRLVAKAFIQNPENKPNINHIDFNPKNNHISNLEWCTQYENIHHTIKHNRDVQITSENHYNAKLKNKDVIEIKSLLKNNIKQKSIAEIFNVDASLISKIKNKKHRLNG